MEKPKVVILCTAYNHEKFIKKALDGFVMQKTNFPFIAVVGDDCSTDRTAEIIKEYAEKYPDIIKPVFQSKNNDGYKNMLDIINYYEAPEYVALCEGDDYWTNPNKLQKQVDFLDNNKEFTICFHPVKVHWEKNEQKDKIYPKQKGRFYKDVLTIDDLLQRNFIQTNSVMYRWIFNKEFSYEDNFPKNILPGDWFLHLMHAKRGKIKFLPDVMGVYLKHTGGIWYYAGQTNEFYFKYGFKVLNFYNEVRNYFNYKNELANKDCRNFIDACLEEKDFERLNKIATDYEWIYNEVIKNDKYNNIVKRLKKETKRSKYILIIGITIILLLLLIILILLYIV